MIKCDKTPKLKEIAWRIDAHLKRMAADPVFNAANPTYGTRPLWWPSAFASGSRVFVRYVSYHGDWSLRKAEALAYLDWLDAGNTGTHYGIERQARDE